MSSPKRRSLFFAALACATACSSPASSPAEVDISGGDLGFTVPKLDALGDTSKPDSATPGDGSTGPTTCPFSANPASGEPGAACKVASDCQSGFCVDSADGKICSTACVDCCPAGMACSQLSSGADFALVCVPQMLALCQPCTTDAQCAALDKNALCVDRGDTDQGNSGKYCGGGCVDSTDCPDGYTCKTVQGEKGAGSQCVPDSGVCACGKSAILAGATTTCKVTNDVGSCAGTRKCALDGLTLCDAPSPTAESCNGKDDNCDGVTDEAGAIGCKLYYGDADDDGFGGGVGVCLCAPDLTHAHSQGADCDDSDPAIHPGAAELCNGKDDNCNGLTDEPGAQGCTPFYADHDGDGFGAGPASCQCAASLAFSVTSDTDCNDDSVAISPAASETCNGIDDNCNGLTDEGGVSCTVFYTDADGDGYGMGDGACLCKADASHTASVGGDCDDTLASVHPKAVEACNGIDDNCNGLTDEGAAAGCTVFYQDKDGDKFGGGVGACLCAADATFTTSKGGDCDDADKSINPKADEVCNGKDDNCDGVTDEAGAEGCLAYFVDSDGDGFGGDALAPKCQCAPLGVDPALVAGDCLDSSKAVYPGAPEICDTLDNNCDGITDPVGSGGCQAHYFDGDGDGYGTGASECSCGADGSFTAVLDGDCDDTAASIHPGAAEICNGKDDNCNGQTDEGVAGGTYYQDSDGDGYGNSTVVVNSCVAPAGYVALGGDCNDNNSNIHPGAAEICDGLDNNCNGQTDENGGTSLFYVDGDGDGYGAGPSVALCQATGGYASKNGDCNDQNAAIYPGATEICNGIDDNCNGQTDEGLTKTTYYPDKDGDGYPASTGSIKACAAPAGYMTGGGLFAVWDCNDNDPTIHPSGPCFFGQCIGPSETKCDGIDNDCDGQTDEGLTKTYYQDKDGDGYGNPAISETICPPQPAGYVNNNADCNDSDKTIHPGAFDDPALCDAIDQDCTKYSACGTCTPAMAYNFDTDASGWTGSGWQLTNSLTSSNAMAYTNLDGFDYTAGSTASAAFAVPTGAIYLQFTVFFGNETDAPSDSSYTYDTGATVTVSIGADQVVVGPYGGPGTYTVKVPVNPAIYNTTATVSATVKTTTTSYTFGSGFAIDNIQVVCN